MFDFQNGGHPPYGILMFPIFVKNWN